MFKQLKNIEEYEGNSPLLTYKEVDNILKWTHLTTYAAISNNGFLDVYLDKRKILFYKNHVKALVKCDAGALIMYKGFTELQKKC